MSRQAEELQRRLATFGVRTARIARRIGKDVAAKHVAQQLVAAALSPAATYAEARDAESRADFVHTCKACIKELRETEVWLRVASELFGSNHADSEAVAGECSQLTAILVASVKSARARLASTRR